MGNINSKCPKCSCDYELGKEHIGMKMRCGVCDKAFMMLDLTGLTVEIAEKTAPSTGRKVIPAKTTLAVASEIIRPAEAEEEPEDNRVLILSGLICLAVIGLYLFLPMSPFNTKSPKALKKAEKVKIFRNNMGQPDVGSFKGADSGNSVISVSGPDSGK